MQTDNEKKIDWITQCSRITHFIIIIGFYQLRLIKMENNKLKWTIKYKPMVSPMFQTGN